MPVLCSCTGEEPASHTLPLSWTQSCGSCALLSALGQLPLIPTFEDRIFTVGTHLPLFRFCCFASAVSLLLFLCFLFCCASLVQVRSRRWYSHRQLHGRLFIAVLFLDCQLLAIIPDPTTTPHRDPRSGLIITDFPSLDSQGGLGPSLYLGPVFRLVLRVQNTIIIVPPQEMSR